MTFSYSRIGGFENCKFAWKMNYIDDDRGESNFFAEYGLLVHDVLEKYFKNELDIFELSDYYKKNYDNFIQTSPPPFPANMGDDYYNKGLEFFDNFDFPIDEYEIISVEDTFHIDINGFNVIIKPDLVVKHRSSGKYSLVDYKSSILFKRADFGKQLVKMTKGKKIETFVYKSNDKKESMEKYKKQMFLYCYGIEKYYGIKIDYIRIWFPRQDRTYTFRYDQDKCNETIKWFLGEIDKIKAEKDWKPITDGMTEKQLKNQKYWCSYICGYTERCPYAADRLLLEN